MFFLGQRVVITTGVLRGEKATIVAHPKSGEWYVAHPKRMVWIKFDEDGEVYGVEKGYAILSEQWYEVDRLKEVV